MVYKTPKHPQMNQAESLSVDFGRAELSGAQRTAICFQLRPQNLLGWQKSFEIPSSIPLLKSSQLKQVVQEHVQTG